MTVTQISAAQIGQDQSGRDILNTMFDEIAAIRKMLGAGAGGSGAGILVGTETFVIPSIANTAGTGVLSTGATVTGAALGDFVLVSGAQSFGGLTVCAYVSATNTVKTAFTNTSGGTLNLGSTVLKYMVIPQAAVAQALAAMVLSK